MENAKKVLSELSVKLNKAYDIFKPEELEVLLLTIDGGDVYTLSRLSCQLLDICIKNEVYYKYHKLFDALKSDFNLSQDEEEKNNIINSFFNILKKSRYDYYLCGGIAVDLAIGNSFTRNHNNLDIVINENDVDNILGELYNIGIDNQDNRNSCVNRNDITNRIIQKPSHEVIAYTDNFYIGFFLFNRDQNGLMHKRDYFNQNGKPMIMERKVSEEEEQLSYMEKDGLKISSFERIYLDKLYRGKPKDYLDMLSIKEHIDYEKIKALAKFAKGNYLLEDVKEERSVLDGLSKIS